MKLYIASSWRNTEYDSIVARLSASHECYDFRHPDGRIPDVRPFSWAAIDPEWQNWTMAEYRKHLRTHPLALQAFASDCCAIDDADGVVLVQPCGISAHLEAALAVGMGKPVVSVGTLREPELMLAMVDAILAGDELDLLDDWLMLMQMRRQTMALQLAGFDFLKTTPKLIANMSRTLNNILPVSTPLGVRRLLPLLALLTLVTEEK